MTICFHVNGITFTFYVMFSDFTVDICLFVRKLRSSRPQQIVLNLCLALLGLYTSFLAGIDKPHLGTVCIVFGGLIHYFCLASMAWMTVKAVNMYLLFVKVINAQVDRFMIKAFLFAWGKCLHKLTGNRKSFLTTFMTTFHLCSMVEIRITSLVK